MRQWHLIDRRDRTMTMTPRPVPLSGPNPPALARASRRHSGLPALAALCLLWAAAGAWGETPPDDPGPDDPWMAFELEERIAAVNEGSLQFLPEAPAGAHRHLNRIEIQPESLDSGWIRLTQCHEQLDAVPAAQILFNPEGIRDLRVLSARHIGQAEVEGHSIQLRDIGKDAALCIGGESRALYALGDGRYRLRNGPYMRRFLDGYYPLRVRLEVSYPPADLAFLQHQPAAQPGFDVSLQPGRVTLEAAFEGRLHTCLDFCQSTQSDCGFAPTPCADH